MDKHKILHEILKGMDPYLSCGVPTIYWKLAKSLTLELYGKKGLKLLNAVHKTKEDPISHNNSITNYIQGWKDNGHTRILPSGLIRRLKNLDKEY